MDFDIKATFQTLLTPFSSSDLKKCPVIGVRHVQTLLLFLAITINYAVRLNTSVSLVAMTNAETTNPDFHEFDWNEKQKSYILSSFFWGYIITQFPAGFMARKLGVKMCLLIATLGSSLLNIIIPLCVSWGDWQAFCAIRACQGLFQGLLFPSAHAHLAIWSPIEERTRLGGLAHYGSETGTVVAMGLTGIIATSGFGWPGISYIYGGAGIVFCAIWLIFAENNPSNARFITSDEKNFILKSQASVDGETKVSIPIPWKAIATSIPFISLLVVRISQNWGSSTLQTQIPAYLHGVLNMNMKKNTLYSTLPYITQWVFSFVYILAAEIILRKKWAPLNKVRKTVNTISMWIPAALLIGVGFLDESQEALAMFLLTLNIGLNGGTTVGSLLNLLDLSPNHTGILTSILNFFTNIIPILTPLAAGLIVYDESQQTLWQIVFLIAAAFLFFGNLQFLFFGSTDTQPWNDERFLLKKHNGWNTIQIRETPEMEKDFFYARRPSDKNSKIFVY